MGPVRNINGKCRSVDAGMSRGAVFSYICREIPRPWLDHFNHHLEYIIFIHHQCPNIHEYQPTFRSFGQARLLLTVTLVDRLLCIRAESGSNQPRNNGYKSAKLATDAGNGNGNIYWPGYNICPNIVLDIHDLGASMTLEYSWFMGNHGLAAWGLSSPMPFFACKLQLVSVSTYTLCRQLSWGGVKVSSIYGNQW